MITFGKDPDAELDYQITWSTYLESGDTIASASWTVPAGLTQPQAATSTTTTTTVWLAGGTEGETYTVSCEITTASGRVDVRSFKVCVVSS